MSDFTGLLPRKSDIFWVRIDKMFSHSNITFELVQEIARRIQKLDEYQQTKLSVTYSESFDVFLSKISAIQSQDPLKCTGYPKVHTFFRIYGVHFKEEAL